MFHFLEVGYLGNSNHLRSIYLVGGGDEAIAPPFWKDEGWGRTGATCRAMWFQARVNLLRNHDMAFVVIHFFRWPAIWEWYNSGIVIEQWTFSTSSGRLIVWPH